MPATTTSSSAVATATTTNVPLPAAPSSNMSIKIGGRHVTPAFPVVDGSLPSQADILFNNQLMKFSKNHIPLETTEGIRRRERVLDRMGSLCREWIEGVCEKLGLPNEVVKSAGGQLFTSGSYRLGVHEPGADIDTILVAPNMCTREDFFGSISSPEGGGVEGGNSHHQESDDIEQQQQQQQQQKRDPNSLAERIKRHPDVTNFVPVENAAVPILTFDWEGVNIDLLFARLASASVPPDLDIDNDGVLDGVDSATEKSLNGPRVTNLIAALVSGGGGGGAGQERYQSFLSVVRCIRKWAKARGLYSNKMGYWGGVNINIAVALVVQLYPNAAPSALLRKFFLVFKSWRWPNPVMLTRPHDAKLGLPVWSAFGAAAARQVAPIITPAYPAMNSTLSVSRQTLQILHEEFVRGHDIMDKLWKGFKGGKYPGYRRIRKNETSEHDNDDDDEDDEGDGSMFAELFEPSDFFISYPYYLSLCIVGPTQDDVQSWAGFVESRLRKLVSDLLGKSLPLSKIQLWPKKFEACMVDRAAGASTALTSAQRRNCVTYFIGFQVDKLRMRGNQLDVERQLQNFREYELSRFQPLVNGQDVLVRSYTVFELPRIVFDSTYGEELGKEGAMKRRKSLRDADPKRQEKKRLAKLRELKDRMALMQRKLEEKKETEEEDEVVIDVDDNDNEDEIDVHNKNNKDSSNDDGKAAVTVSGVKDENDISTDNTPQGNNNNKEEEEANSKNGNGVSASSATEGTIKDEATATVAGEDHEDEDMLENVLDDIQDSADVAGTAHKTREEAALDRQKLLAGELLTEGGPADDDDDNDGKDKKNGDGDNGGEMMQAVAGGDLGNGNVDIDGSSSSAANGANGKGKKRKRRDKMTVAEIEAELLKNAGYSIVSDDEVTILGESVSCNFVPPWARSETLRTMMQKEEDAKRRSGGNCEVIFRTKFDVVELDVNGFVIDKGDEDFTPSMKWIGRKGGFEFKLGERGLGYYRTGKKVVVPSNMAY